MNAQQLKNSILQMAVQGKLIPQDPTDEPAEVLLTHIREEKQRLIKDGKIKKDKTQSIIFERDGSYYERIGKVETCIDEEIIFDLPLTWNWVRLRDLTVKDIKRGKSPKYTEMSSVYVFAQKCNTKKGIIDLTLAKHLDLLHFKKYDISEYMESGDIIINSTGGGTMGRVGIFYDSDRIDNNCVIPDSHVTIVRNSKLLVNEYIYFVLKYYQPMLETLGEGSTNQTELRPNVIGNLLIPLPPLKEQTKIVQKLKELEPNLEEYSVTYTSLNRLNNLFPDQLKKSILQHAVQGQLVDQNPTDEPAEVLLTRIREEKQRLIKEGKIKKDKNESIIFERDGSYYERIGKVETCIDEEIPFEIPKSWGLIRLNDIGIYKKGPFGSALTKSIFVKKGNNTIKVYEQKNAIKKDHTLGDYYITKEYYNAKMKSFTVNAGDIIVSCAGTIGETYVLPEGIEKGIINQALMKMEIFTPINIDYFLLYFDYVLKESTKSNSKGSAIKNIPPFKIFKKLLLPLPPLQEQERIVKKVNNLLTLIDNLYDVQ